MAHIWLIGMMGTGKSTVGTLVAEALQLPFVDVDRVIVEETGRTIEDLFAEGEHQFREAERIAIARIARRPGHVVATGGGSVLDQENVATMRTTGRTVLLTASSETLAERLDSTSDRPLVTNAVDVAAIAAARSTVYADSADATVDTTGLSAAEVADEVVRCVDM